MGKKKSTAKNNAVVRTNAPSGIDVREQYRTAMSRYIDPLIVMKYHNKQLAEVREVVAEADPIASVLTHAFSEAAAAKMIKFYESDQLDSPEIMMDLRAMLKVFKFQEYMKEVMLRGQTHGWWLVYPYLDEESQIPIVEIYSEFECKAEYITYDLQNNIQFYNVNFQPRVGFNRRTNLHWVYRKFQPQQVMHGTRGRWNYGFGYSILEGSWDAITKLREESHTNAFKQKILPFVRVSDDWTDAQIDEFMKTLAKTDEISALVMRTGINPNDGTPIDLPAVQWATPANSTPAKSSQGSGGSVSDLSSEWSRLTGATRRSVAYFVGGGALSASRAAAGVDSLDDVDQDIIDFNQYLDEFIIPFVKWFASVINYPIPDTFTVKGWWEWTRDEALYQQIAEKQQQREDAMAQIQDDQASNADRKNLLTEMKTLARLPDSIDPQFQLRLNTKLQNNPNSSPDKLLMEVVHEIIDESNRTNQIQRLNAITDHLNTHFESLLLGHEEEPIEEKMRLMVYILALNRNNLIPNTLVPVNSSSGNTESAFLEDSPSAKALWVKFKGPYNWYRYQDPDANLSQIGDNVASQGGEAVWSDLRGLGNAPLDAQGKLPAGTPRATAATSKSAPLAGRPHDQYGLPYQAMGTQGPPIPSTPVPPTPPPIGQYDPYSLGTASTLDPSSIPMPTQAGAYDPYAVGTTPLATAIPNAPDTTAFPVDQGIIRPQSTDPSFPSMDQYDPYMIGGTNLTGQTPKKEAYSAGFVWGSSKKPQGYAQRPIGMKTKTEASTMDMIPNQTASIPEIQAAGSVAATSTPSTFGSANIAGESPAKAAYSADFVWGSSKSPQGYEQRPKGMKTKTEASTALVMPEVTASDYGFFEVQTATGKQTVFGKKGVGSEGLSKSRKNYGLMLSNPKDVPEEFYLHPLLQEFNSMNGIRKNLHIGSEKADKLLEEELKDCERNNLAALATAMHTMNPFIYKVDNGYRIEYMCPDSLKQLEGAEVPFGLWHNLDDEECSSLPDWQIIGSYKVKSIDGQKDLSEIHYNDDWEEKAVAIIDRLKGTRYYQDMKTKDWLDHYIENVKKGLHGDISTGIVTDVKYNKEKKKWIQTNIKLKSVSAVPLGNCSSPYCSTKDLPPV
jgi:hypothetical protein